MDKFLFGVVLAGVMLSTGLSVVQGQTAQDEVLSANDPLCNGTAKNGTIILTPSLNVTTCNITVEGSSSPNYTTIIFSRLDLKGQDELTIYDGEKQVLNVTGSRESLVVIVTSPRAYLIVQITANKSGSVLQATYNTSGCEIQQTVDSTSILQSPVYLPDVSAFECNYTLRQPGVSNRKLALSFLQVLLPNATLSVTSSSSMTVNGTSLPPDVYSSDTIQMVLSVPKVSGVQKFSAAISTISTSSECGQVKEINMNDTLSIMLPALEPLPYDCRVTLKAAKGKSLWLNMTSVQLVGQGDSLEVVDGPSLAGSNMLALFTTTTAGYLVLSGQDQVLVRLVSGLKMGDRSLTVNVKELSTVNHMYNKGSFMISASSGSTLVTQYYVMETLANSVVKFVLEGQKMNKTYDYTVSVYDGDQPCNPLLVTFSSNTRVPVVSSGNRLLVVASVSNASASLGASFSTQAPGCDKITSAPEGSFQLMTSPSVPSMCQWTVTAPPGSTGTILLDMTKVKLTKNATLSVYSGVAGSGGSKVAYLTNVSGLLPELLPSVAVPASQWAQVVWSSGNSSNLTSVAVSVHYQLHDTLCGGPIQASQGHLYSPAFPNLYPLNTVCQWTFPASKPGRLLFFDFPQFHLAQNHSVTITEMRNGTVHQVASFSGSAPLPDVLYASNTTNNLTFSAQLPKSVAVSNQVAQGFDIQYWTLDCGGFTNKSKGSFSSPGYPSQIPISPANATVCVWFVQLPNKTGDNPNIVNLTLQILKTGSPSVTDLVKVYDGNTVRHGLIPLNMSKGDTVNVLSRYNSVIVIFNITVKTTDMRAEGSKLALSVNYTTFSCNKTFQCNNGLCMHPDWRCNGNDDCGDNSDEKDCVGPPTPVHPSSASGTKPAIVVLLFFVGLLLGILLAVIIPRIIRRFRTNRYSTFRDEPPVA